MGILASMYSVFMPFLNNLGDISQYNIAYYGALWSIERWMLVTRYKDPWFEWTGWRLDASNYGPMSDYGITDFERLNWEGNGMWWNIKSRTQRIPTLWNGNVDYLLAASDSEDYNMLWYNAIESFLLSYDNTSAVDEYYTYTNVSDKVNYDGSSVIWNIRLPAKLYNNFGGWEDAKLCDNSWYWLACDPDEDRLYNDPVADRSFDGSYLWETFLIMPNQAINYYTEPEATIDDIQDTVIREAFINDGLPLSFVNTYNPINPTYNTPTEQNVISADTWVADLTFRQLYSQTDDLKLQIWLVNLLINRIWDIYPFLEYYFEFDGEVADRFFHVYGQSRVGKYDVKMKVTKPTAGDTVVGDFTVIF